MYRWLELYERKHAELFRVIARFARDKVVWQGLAGRATERGAINYAHMQAAMSGRLEHNATVTFKTAESGAHHDWVSATSFDDLATKIDGWRDAVFKWMDDKVSALGSHIYCLLMTGAGYSQSLQGFLK
jgi:hypothetical protein